MINLKIKMAIYLIRVGVWLLPKEYKTKSFIINLMTTKIVSVDHG